MTLGCYLQLIWSIKKRPLGTVSLQVTVELEFEKWLKLLQETKKYEPDSEFILSEFKIEWNKHENQQHY